MIRARVRKCAKFFYDDFTEVTEGVTLTCKIVFYLPSSKQIQSTLIHDKCCKPDLNHLY